jgi:hypothetical protein
MEQPHRHDVGWRELCRQVAKEDDPEKLIELVQRLNEALEERQRPAQPLSSETPKLQEYGLEPPRCCPVDDMETNSLRILSSEGRHLARLLGCV